MTPSGPRLAVFGAGGQLATDLLARRPDAAAFTRADVDVTDASAVHEAVSEASADVIINASAYTAVDACETDEAAAMAVNAHGVANLVEAADRCGARVLHVSTDYVFDGTADRPYHEWDVPNPQSAYGRTKLAGEQRLRGVDTVVRTSWLCGPHGSNILKTIVRLARDDTPLTFVDDQVGNPSFTGDVADVILRLVDAEVAGTFHVTNDGSVSWYEFVREVLTAMGRSPEQVSAVSTSELTPPRPAPRPANSRLDNLALRLWGLEAAPDFRASLPGVVATLMV